MNAASARPIMSMAAKVLASYGQDIGSVAGLRPLDPPATTLRVSAAPAAPQLVERPRPDEKEAAATASKTKPLPGSLRNKFGSGGRLSSPGWAGAVTGTAPARAPAPGGRTFGRVPSGFRADTRDIIGYGKASKGLEQVLSMAGDAAPAPVFSTFTNPMYEPSPVEVESDVPVGYPRGPPRRSGSLAPEVQDAIVSALSGTAAGGLDPSTRQRIAAEIAAGAATSGLTRGRVQPTVAMESPGGLRRRRGKGASSLEVLAVDLDPASKARRWTEGPPNVLRRRRATRARPVPDPGPPTMPTDPPPDVGARRPRLTRAPSNSKSIRIPRTLPRAPAPAPAPGPLMPPSLPPPSLPRTAGGECVNTVRTLPNGRRVTVRRCYPALPADGPRASFQRLLADPVPMRTSGLRTAAPSASSSSRRASGARSGGPASGRASRASRASRS